MNLLALLIGLFLLHVWWKGNVSWYESHGWPVLIPLNLGIVWFFGFPYYAVGAYKIRPDWVPGGNHLSIGQGTLVALTWVGGLIFFEWCCDVAREAGKKRKGKPDQ
jgi:hypothetical protein